MVDTIVPKEGERVLICGQTGSGKTVAMCVLAGILSSRSRVAVLDTKIESRYARLPRARITPHASTLWGRQTRYERRDGPDIRIWRPSPEIAQSPEQLDGALYQLYDRFDGTIIIDELYPFHVSARAGPGMTALLTRGRSRGLTTIMGSQRPSWISRFCVSEAQHYWVYPLVDRQDRRRLSEVIPNYPVDKPPPRHHFHYYSHGEDMDNPILFKPLQLHDKEAEAPETARLDKALIWL